MSTSAATSPHQVVGMAANPVAEQVWRIAEPLCRSEGMELVQVEFQREQGGRTLRLYLDKPGGITLADCTEISRQLSDMLDVSLDAQMPYRLEVSSPGEQRPLGKINDFERFNGYRAKIRTVRPINGQKNFTGTLQGVDGTNVRLQISGGTLVVLAFAEIAKAQLVGFLEGTKGQT